MYTAPYPLPPTAYCLLPTAYLPTCPSAIISFVIYVKYLPTYSYTRSRYEIGSGLSIAQLYRTGLPANTGPAACKVTLLIYHGGNYAISYLSTQVALLRTP